MQELLDRFSALSAVQLDGEAKRLNKSRARAEWELAACLQAMREDERYRELGYQSVLLYAEGELGLSARKSIELLRVARLAQEFPSVSEAFSRGEVSFCKLREITRKIEPSTAEGWVEYARTHTTRQVERAVARSPRAYRKQVASDVAVEDSLPQQEGLPFVEEAAENPDVGASSDEAAENSGVGSDSEAHVGGKDGAPSGTTTGVPGVVLAAGGQQGALEKVDDSPTSHADNSTQHQRPIVTNTAAGPTGAVQGGSSKARGGGKAGDAPPPGPVLVRLTLTLTAEQYAIYEAAEKLAKGKLRKRATREEALTLIAKEMLNKASSRTRARYPVVVQTEDGQPYYPTKRGDLPADVEKLRTTMAEQPPVAQSPQATAKTPPDASKASLAGAKKRRAARSVANKTQAQPRDKSAGKKASTEQPPDSTHSDKPKVSVSSRKVHPGTTPAHKRREVPTRVLRAVMARARWQCEECGSRDVLELDHKIAVIDGGENSEDNLCVKCRHCHRSRHTADFINDPRYLMGLDYAEARREARLEAEEDARAVGFGLIPIG